MPYSQLFRKSRLLVVFACLFVCQTHANEPQNEKAVLLNLPNSPDVQQCDPKKIIQRADGSEAKGKVQFIGLNKGWSLAKCGQCVELVCTDERCQDKTKKTFAMITQSSKQLEGISLSPATMKELTGDEKNSQFFVSWKNVPCPLEFLASAASASASGPSSSSSSSAVDVPEKSQKGDSNIITDKPSPKEDKEDANVSASPPKKKYSTLFYVLIIAGSLLGLVLIVLIYRFIVKQRRSRMTKAEILVGTHQTHSWHSLEGIATPEMHRNIEDGVENGPLCMSWNSLLGTPTPVLDNSNEQDIV